jgi:hypothetical protein
MDLSIVLIAELIYQVWLRILIKIFNAFLTIKKLNYFLNLKTLPSH